MIRMSRTAAVAVGGINVGSSTTDIVRGASRVVRVSSQMLSHISGVIRTTFLLMLGLTWLGTHAHAADRLHESTGSPRGKYVLRLAAGDGGFCKDFTANLNQFRNLDFATCNPRLSPKYPQLTRPAWKQIPFNMELAKTIITEPISPYWKLGWERWLKSIKAARAAGDVKLWRLRADLLGDGHLETLVRLDHTGLGEGPYCPYFDSKQLVLSGNGVHVDKFYTSGAIRQGLGSDLIYDTATKQYYFVEWNSAMSSAGHGEGAVLGRDRDFKNIGATASVMVYRAVKQGVGPVCWIDWVPAHQTK